MRCEGKLIQADSFAQRFDKNHHFYITLRKIEIEEVGSTVCLGLDDRNQLLDAPENECTAPSMMVGELKSFITINYKFT